MKNSVYNNLISPGLLKLCWTWGGVGGALRPPNSLMFKNIKIWYAEFILSGLLT